MGLGPIPMTAMLAYAKDIDGETGPQDLRRFVRFVRAIDDEYLTAEAAREKQSSGAG